MTIKLNYFFRVDVNVVQYDAGTTTTKTYSFVNKALKDSTSIMTYWPILKSVGEVSLRAGETLPDVSLSSIEIDNSIGSFGANRKFSDVLQRYTPIEQTVAIYVAEESTSTDSVSSWVEWGRGVISDYEASSAGEEPTLTFNIRPIRLSETVLTLEVNRSLVGMENAPDSSLGKAIPLLIGSDLDCIPIRINADGSAFPVYAIGTCLKSHLTNRTASASVYAKNELDDWEVCLNNFTDRTTLATGLGYYTLNTYAGRASALGENPSGIVHGIKLRCKGNGLASSTARLSVFILRYDSVTKQVIEEVARGTQDLSVYNTQNAASTNPIDISIALDRVAFLSANEHYAVGWDVQGYQVNDMSISYSTAVTTDGFIRDSSDTASSSGFSWKYIVAGGALNLGVIRYDLLYYDPTFSDSEIIYTQTGLTFSKVTLFSESVDSGQTIPPLDNFPILVGGMQGLTTYGGSTIVEKPQDIANLLNYKWDNNSAAWVDQSYWDTTTLESSHYDYLYNGATPAMRSRVARAVFDSKVTFSQVLSEVCRGTASNVGILMNGKTFMYPFGLTETPAADIPPSDIISTLSWVQGDISTVINRAVIKTGRSYLSAPRFFEGQEITGYQFVTDYSAANEAKVAEITLKSRTLYGDKELANGEFIVWPYPSGGVGAYLCTTAGTGDAEKQGSIIAEYYLARFGSPVVQCSFIVPYSRYRSLRMFNVITFTSPNFPAFYGTEANANDGVVAAFPLDKVSGTVAAAYSTRKLKSNYSGSAIRVRRSSDNTEQDIGFTADGSFDSTAFTTFVGVGTGYAVTWYDQSGNGRNATQTTQANQGVVASNGVTFDGTDDFFDLGTNMLSTSDKLSITWWENVTSTAGTVPSRFKLSLTSGSRSFLIIRAPSGTFAPFSFIGSQPTNNTYLKASTAPSLATCTGVWKHWAVVADNTVTSPTAGDWRVYVDGTAQTITTGGAAGGFGNSGNRMGQDDLGDSPANCAMNDIIIYSTALSASDVSTLASNANVTTNITTTTLPTADAGYETVRADTYRGLIKGITNIAAMEHSPAIKLDVLVLLNAPFDPT